MEKETVVLDWRNLSSTKIFGLLQVVATEEQKTEFLEKCIGKKNGTNVLNKKETREWLDKNFDGKFEWKNKPTGTTARKGRESGIDKMIRLWGKKES